MGSWNASGTSEFGFGLGVLEGGDGLAAYSVNESEEVIMLCGEAELVPLVRFWGVEGLSIAFGEFLVGVGI